MTLAVSDAITKLSASDLASRGEAVESLMKTKPTEEKKIEALLSSKSVPARAAAALALGNWGKDASGSAKGVSELLQDSEEDLTWMPLNVGGGSMRAPMAYRKPKCAALIALGNMKSEAYLAQMTEALSDGDWEIRFCALEAMASLGEAAKGSAGKIAALLDDETYPVRGKACAAIGAIKAEDQVDKLSEMLEDSAQCVRAEALGALAAMGDPGFQYSGAMYGLLSDDSNIVRAAAATALAALGEGGKPYASGVAGLLSDPMPDVRCAAALALGKMGTYGAAFAEEVADLAQDFEPEVQAAANEALALMGEEGSKAITN